MRTLMVTLTALVAVGTAAAGGGPTPGALAGSGVLVGWDGVSRAGLRYVALPDASRTTVAAVRRQGGRIVRYGSIPGEFGIPFVALDSTPGGLSVDGRTLVLASIPGAPNSTTYSRFAVVRVPGMKLQRLVTLRGLFSFDALSPDAKTLFVIEYRTDDGSRYRVRSVDLTTGRLIPRVIAEKGATTMSGLALTRETSRDGRWAYTLYRSPGATAFVHALDTVRRQAICIELPWRGEAQNGLEVARLSLDPQGRTLTVRQPGVGTLATVDTRAYRVTVSRRPVAVS